MKLLTCTPGRARYIARLDRHYPNHALFGGKEQSKQAQIQNTSSSMYKNAVGIKFPEPTTTAVTMTTTRPECKRPPNTKSHLASHRIFITGKAQESLQYATGGQYDAISLLPVLLGRWGDRVLSTPRGATPAHTLPGSVQYTTQPRGRADIYHGQSYPQNQPRISSSPPYRGIMPVFGP
ncbi:hypothetical protein N656DRAFT_156418 [Canariomyces notabilis]|uniref:Uncharacterized protein n=1 Tax=Canariomyces notabilis TaxID=2074819 RepID=A0AAN6TBJ9_9PEZI|nr:hypothetical protein N656DRAFT_156418 [Canariomyces arenarius]